MQSEEDTNHTEGAAVPLLWELCLSCMHLHFIHELTTEMDLGVIPANVHYHTCDPGSQADHECILML